MKRCLLYIICFILIGVGGESCSSKKQCADFSDPKRNYSANYNKKGLVKKKGYKTKQTWDNR